jgi:DHA1 family tetracycline resistance protein-like MFS transporter
MPRPTRSKLVVAYLILVILADFIGLGVSVTTFPALLLKAGGASPAGVGEARQLVVLGLLLGIYPLGQFLGAAILGKFSDMRGRRPLLLWTLTGTLAAFVVSALAIQAGNLWLLFISRALAGTFAGNVAIAQASMVDISDDDSKSGNLAMLNAAMGISWIIGPPVGGVLSDSHLVSWFTYSTPFWAEAILLGLMVLVTLVFFKETLIKPVDAKIDVFAGLQQIRSAFAMPKLRLAFLIWAVFVVGWWLFESYLPTYLQQVFKYSPARVGAFLGFMGTTFTVTSLFVVKPLAPKLRPETMVRWFLPGAALAVALLAFAQTAWHLHVSIFLFVFTMGFALPGLLTTISNFANADTQGQTMGMTASIQALMTVLAMMSGGSLFAMSQYVTVFGGAGLLLFAWLLFNITFRERASEDLAAGAATAATKSA